MRKRKTQRRKRQRIKRKMKKQSKELEKIIIAEMKSDTVQMKKEK